MSNGGKKKPKGKEHHNGSLVTHGEHEIDNVFINRAKTN